MNAHGVGEVVLGASTSQLLENLGRCYSSVLGPGDEVSMHADSVIGATTCRRACGCPWQDPSEQCSAAPVLHGTRLYPLWPLVTTAC